MRPTGDSNSFRVGKGVLSVRVEVLTEDQITTIEVIPRGLALMRAINSMTIGREVETAIRQSEPRPT